jgi:hypothetical protein
MFKNIKNYFFKIIISIQALAAWRSGHHVRLRNRTSEFESRQDVRIFREKHTNAVE